MPISNVEGFELSPQQLHLWGLRRAGSGAFEIARCRVAITGPLETGRLAKALDEVVARHEILRTAFQVLPGMSVPLQVLLPECPPELSVADLRNLRAAALEAELDRLDEALAAPEIDLARGPFLRALLARRPATEHTLLLALPALHCDATGLENLVREIAGAYAPGLEGARTEPIQYVDVADVLNDLLTSPDTREGRDYWRRQDHGQPPDLPCERPAAGEPFRPACSTRPVTLAGTTGRTLDVATWLAGWWILLERHAGPDRLDLALTLDGRTYEGLDAVPGLFARHVPFSCGPLETGLTVRRLLAGIERRMKEAAEWQDFFSWETTAGAAGEPAADDARDTFPHYLFTTEPDVDVVSAGDLELSIERRTVHCERFKLALTRAGDGRLARFEYDAGRFHRRDVELLAERWTCLLEALRHHPEARLEELEILGHAERHRLLYELNDTTCAIAGKGLHQLVEDQVARAPERIAVVLGEDQLTYGELDRRADRLAGLLRRAGVGPEVRVALHVERSLGMLAGMLAILKAGGAYLPLDPSYPPARLSAMLADGETPVLLTEERLLGSLEAGGARVIRLDRDDEIGAPATREEPPTGTTSRNATPASLAYTIYTSGSTGVPKGVMVSHRAIVNRLLWMQRLFPLRVTDRVLQKTVYSFDASIWEIFEPLLAGACVVLCRPEAHRDGAELLKAVADERVTVLQLVPSMLTVFASLDGVTEGCRSLRRLFCGGEALAADLAARAAELLDVELCNLYGPTESAIDASFHPCPAAAGFGASPGTPLGSVPIGRPLDNVDLHLTDPRLRPVPTSHAGELCIGGHGLARGYHGRPAATAERFVPHPFGSRPGDRLYKTGDLARHLPAGEIEFLGRRDRQVKLRGFRIELGEIEAILNGHEDVHEAAVSVQSRGGGADRRARSRAWREERLDALVAWVVPRAGVELSDAAAAGEDRPAAVSSDELREHLGARLPEHMLPTLFLPLAALPRLPNGKLDRDAFPDPEPVLSGPEVPHVSPRTPLEKTLMEIWTDALDGSRPGIRDNFFEIGGNSLVATAVVARISKELDVRLAIRELFVQPTVETLARKVEEALRERTETADLDAWIRARKARGDTEPAIPRRRQDGPSPLSFAQQRLWFLDQLVTTSAYHLPSAISLRGPIDVAALTRSLAEVVRRHENLRSRFVRDGDQPLQITAPGAAVDLPIIDLQALSSAGAETTARALARAEARRPFDLEAELLLRARLVHCEGDAHVLLFTLHHIVSDGWSNGVLTREVGALYRAFQRRRPSPLAELPIQYADYAVWQRDRLRGEILQAQLDFWRRELAAPPALLELPTDRRRPAVQSFRGGVLRFTLEADLVSRLEHLGRRADATPFMVLLAGFQTLMTRLSGQSDVLVGSPIANRTRPELEALIGFFVNTLVLRGDLSADPSARQLLAQVRERTLAAYDHQELPFEKLVEELGLTRSLRHAPLFQVVLAFQNVPPSAAEVFGESVHLEPWSLDTGTAKFDLTLAMTPVGDRLLGRLEYSSDLFDETTARRWMKHFEVLLGAIASDESAGIRSLPMLAPAELQQLVSEWNGTTQHGVSRNDLEEPAGPCLHELFEDRAAATPDAVALTCDGENLTYRELDRRARKLACVLRSRGLRAGERVAVLAERGLDMVIAILGVLQGGGAYVPLDPTYPEKRLAFMVQDMEAPLLVTQNPGLVDPDRIRARTVILDRDLFGGPSPGGDARRRPAPRPTDLGPAYVIYTSGSTGRPKGVVVSHRNVARLFSATSHWFTFDGRDVWTLFHSYAFDFSVWELWGALLFGGRLVVVPYWVSRSPEAFLRRLADERVTILNQTPSAFRQLTAAESRNPEPHPLSLRLVIFGGEALEPASLVPWFERHPDRPSLINMYGITETTVHVTYRPMTRADLDGPARSAIGRPIPDLSLHLLDPRLELQPLGVSGELCVGGAGLARGYLRRPALTAERFIPDPWSACPGARLYRSGDLGRRLPGGDVEYLGRRDHQVKIRGFRIELGEIEAALARHPAVRECLVQAVQPDDAEDLSRAPRLIAWVVRRAETPLRSEDLSSALRRQLPDHMVPSAFVPMDAMPLTDQGKIDRRALPAPGAARPELGSDYAPPTSEIEEILAGIWSRVTGIEQVGIHDNFFALGGDSIRSVSVLALARERGLEFSLQQLFQLQTVHELAKYLESRGGIDAAGEPETDFQPTLAFELIAPADRESLPERMVDAYPLTMLQAGMLYRMELTPESAFYHNVNSYHLRCPFEPPAFQRAVDRAVSRHAVLRTSFDLTSYAEPLQLVHGSARLPVTVEDLRSLPASRQEEEVDRHIAGEIARPFDVSRPPLLRFHVHLRTAETFQFTLTESHPIFDGWSLQSTLHEIFQDYCAFLDGQAPPPRPPPGVAFRDFVALEKRVLAAPASRDFWTRKLRGAAPTRLPTWHPPRDYVPGTRRHYLRVEISGAVSDGLKRLARDAAVPVKSVLLGAHLKALSWLATSDEVLTGLSSHGRLEALDGEDVRGLFLNTLPLRHRLTGGSWIDLVREVFAAERELLPHRRYPLPAIQKLHGDQPLFETLFNYVHFHVLQGIERLLDLEVLDFKKFERTSIPLLSGFRQDVSTRELGLELAFHPERLTREEVELFGGYYRRILGTMAEDPEQRHERSSPLSAAQRHQILTEWNDTSRRLGGAFFHRIFAERARRHPEAVAVELDGSRLSYRDLDRRANRLAHRLLSLGLGPGTRVGLLSEHSFESVIAILAALKSGTAWVPLDPGYPKRHLEFVLRDARLGALMGRSSRVDVPAADLPIVPLDGAAFEGAEESTLEPAVALHPENVAYVIYTSGSTGEPKGVEVDHRALLDYTLWARARYAPQGGLAFALFTSPAFDLTVTSLAVPLASGGRVIVHPRAAADPSSIREIFRDRRHDVVKLTPSHLQLLDEETCRASNVRRLIVGGEDLATDLAGRIAGWFGGTAEIFNEYGPTEATVGCMLHRFRASRDRRSSVPIGMPAANAGIHILGPTLAPVPAGATGEICISGHGLARGYANRPGATAASFVADPFGDGGRIYRTGDLGRRLPSGRVEFLGRRDQQIKLRGHRVELGAVAAALDEHPKIRRSVAIARRLGEGDVLAAYYVARQALPVAELCDFLSDRLPAATITNYFVHLRRLPLNLNGKVEESALPPLVPERSGGHGYLAPRTVPEEVLAAIWARILGREQIGVHDSFFDLGGHSLIAARVIAAVEEVFGVTLPLRAILEAPTVARMSAAIESARRSGEDEGKPGSERPALEALPRDVGAGFRQPLSFSQERMWLAYQVDPSKATYNVPAAMRFEGRLDAGALEASLAKIVERHETLRTRFVETDAGCRQEILPPDRERLPTCDLGRLREQDRERELQAWIEREGNRPFDLERDPLMRVLLFTLGGEEHAFWVNLHHIVTDGWSMGLLLEETMSFYDAAVEKRPAAPAVLPVQYADFAVWQRALLTGERRETLLAFWRRQLEGAPTRLGFPADHPRRAPPRFRGETRSELLPVELARSLEELSRRESVTLFMTLLAAFAVLFHQRTGATDLVIGTTSAGRTRPEIQSLIGCFIQQLALRLDLAGDPTFRELLARAREVYLDADLHQEMPSEELAEALGIEHTVGRSPLYQVQLVLDQHLRRLPGRKELEARPVPWKSRTAKLDLIVACTVRGDGLRLAFEYDSDLFEPSTITDLIADFAAILNHVGVSPEMTVDELAASVRDAAAGRQEAAAQRLRSVGSRFLEQATRRPAMETIDG